VAAGATVTMVFRDCLFYWGTDAASTAVTCASTGRARFYGCTFTGPATAGSTLGVITGTSVVCEDCKFDMSATTTGTFYGFYPLLTTPNASFRGCQFPATGGATFTAYYLGAYTSSAVFEEYDSTFGASVTAYEYTASTSNATARVVLGSRAGRVFADTNAAATYSAPVSQYGFVKVVSSYAGNVTVSIDGFPPQGAVSTIAIDNDDGSSRTFTPLSSVFTSAGAKSIDTTQGNSMLCQMTEYQESGTATLRMHNIWAE